LENGVKCGLQRERKKATLHSILQLLFSIS